MTVGFSGVGLLLLGKRCLIIKSVGFILLVNLPNSSKPTVKKPTAEKESTKEKRTEQRTLYSIWRAVYPIDYTRSASIK